MASCVAAKARVGAARRRKHEGRAAVKPAAVTAADPSPSDLWPVLFEELNRLPNKYREPIVLCISQVSTDDLQKHEADLKFQPAERDVKQTELQRAETRWNRAIALQRSSATKTADGHDLAGSVDAQPLENRLRAIAAKLDPVLRKLDALERGPRFSETTKGAMK
jgi:hypothetical protein